MIYENKQYYGCKVSAKMNEIRHRDIRNRKYRVSHSQKRWVSPFDNKKTCRPFFDKMGPFATTASQASTRCRRHSERHLGRRHPLRTAYQQETTPPLEQLALVGSFCVRKRLAFQNFVIRVICFVIFYFSPVDFNHLL